MAVLTGWPGCGKSYTVRAIVTLTRAKHAKILLAAPTGRAAKRLSELAGLQGATLHRLLQLRPGGDAAFDRDRPLESPRAAAKLVARCARVTFRRSHLINVDAASGSAMMDSRTRPPSDLPG
jgi:ATP-dependent exoDNAse (exonuclease V) alpha subunit